jgi:integrase
MPRAKLDAKTVESAKPRARRRRPEDAEGSLLSGNLDAKTIDAAKPRAGKYRLSDGGGLLLEVKPSGAKVWLCRVLVAGKRRDHGLGGFPTVTLAQARDKALEARREALRGRDPIKARRDAQKAAVAARKAEEEAERRIFKMVAEAVIAAEEPGWKNKKTAPLWRASLETYAAPLMPLPVAEITREKVKDALLPHWHKKPQMARKALRRVGAVLRHAAAQGWGADATAADVRTLRHLGFTKQAASKKQASLPWRQVPAFMQALDAVEGMAGLALRFTILTALRSVEARAVKWAWISFDGGRPTLTIPGASMKGTLAKEPPPHRLPLTAPMIETLCAAYQAAYGGEKPAPGDLPRYAAIAAAADALCFPNATRTGMLTDAGLSAVIRRMNGEGAPQWRDPDGRPVTVHGFRSSFSTWGDDTLPAERDAIERALAHEPEGKVSARYRHSDLFERRVAIMEAWGQHCTKPAAPVVSLPKARVKAKGA